MSKKCDTCIYYIKSKSIKDKIKEVIKLFGKYINKDNLLSRCAKCNNTNFLTLNK